MRTAFFDIKTPNYIIWYDIRIIIDKVAFSFVGRTVLSVHPILFWALVDFLGCKIPNVTKANTAPQSFLFTKLIKSRGHSCTVGNQSHLYKSFFCQATFALIIKFG